MREGEKSRGEKIVVALALSLALVTLRAVNLHLQGSAQLDHTVLAQLEGTLEGGRERRGGGEGVHEGRGERGT